jgi:hypothetical protein
MLYVVAHVEFRRNAAPPDESSVLYSTFDARSNSTPFTNARSVRRRRSDSRRMLNHAFAGNDAELVLLSVVTPRDVPFPNTPPRRSAAPLHPTLARPKKSCSVAQPPRSAPRMCTSNPFWHAPGKYMSTDSASKWDRLRLPVALMCSKFQSDCIVHPLRPPTLTTRCAELHEPPRTVATLADGATLNGSRNDDADADDANDTFELDMSYHMPTGQPQRSDDTGCSLMPYGKQAEHTPTPVKFDAVPLPHCEQNDEPGTEY